MTAEPVADLIVDHGDRGRLVDSQQRGASFGVNVTRGVGLLTSPAPFTFGHA